MVSNKLEETGNALQYGRPLTPYQKDRIIQLEKAGVSMSDIKIIVSSQYINKDGSIRARGLRDGVARGCKNNCVNAHCGGLSQQW